MFRNEQKKIKWFLAIGVAACFAVFMLAAPGMAKTVPKGKVTIAIPTAFEINGGDPHTNTGATGTTIRAWPARKWMVNFTLRWPSHGKSLRIGRKYPSSLMNGQPGPMENPLQR
jgi:hypothetical protein